MERVIVLIDNKWISNRHNGMLGIYDRTDNQITDWMNEFTLDQLNYSPIYSFNNGNLTINRKSKILLY